MVNVSSLVSQVARQVGIDEAAANQAVGSVLNFIKGQLGDSQFGQLLGQIQGADKLANQSSEESSGGLLGGFAKMAGSMLGGEAGDSLELAGKLKGLGLSQEQITKLASTVADFVQSNLGAESLENLKSKIPALGTLLG